MRPGDKSFGLAARQTRPTAHLRSNRYVFYDNGSHYRRQWSACLSRKKNGCGLSRLPGRCPAKSKRPFDSESLPTGRW